MENKMKASAFFLLVCVILGSFGICKAGGQKKEVGEKLCQNLGIVGQHGIGNEDHAKGLKMDYYEESCPQVECIVKNITWSKVANNSTLAAKLLRIHYHDCFVRGCDASLLLDSTSNNTAEKEASPNRALTGYEVIDEIKSKLEKECPNTVSCADIVALVARDAVSYQERDLRMDIKKFTVSAANLEGSHGRKDGRVSLASEVLPSLPSPFADFPTLLQNFENHSLDINDLVTLSGAHTLGRTHCTLIAKRLYNFTGKGDTDPSLDSDYAETLKTICPVPINPATTLEMDPGSSLSFDSHYFVALNQNKTLFLSDSALLTNPQAAALAKDLQNFDDFLEHFKVSINKMGAIGVLTDGKGGEIRKNCRVINP